MKSIGEFYSLPELSKKFGKLLCPFLIIWIAQVAIQLVLIGRLSVTELGYSLVSGGWGPGSYFIPIIFQATLILPIIYMLCRKKPITGAVVLFIVSLTLELLALRINMTESVYRFLIIRYVFALTLGVWLAKYKKKPNAFLIGMLSVCSLIYITGVNYYEGNFIMEDYWQSQHAPSYFYTLVLVMIGLKTLHVKGENLITKLILKIGRASYHIFLAQMFYFWIVIGFVPELTEIMDALINVIVCISMGLVFFESDIFVNKVLSKKKSY